MKFRVKGKFQMGEIMQPFTKEVAAVNEQSAVEKIYCEFGSKHKTPRNKIVVEEIEKIG